MHTFTEDVNHAKKQVYIYVSIAKNGVYSWEPKTDNIMLVAYNN